MCQLFVLHFWREMIAAHVQASSVYHFESPAISAHLNGLCKTRQLPDNRRESPTVTLPTLDPRTSARGVGREL
jgi:hypothetical protein